MTELTNDAVVVALAGSLAFLAAFLVVDPKLRKSAIGKSLIMLDTGLAGLEAPSVLHRFLGLEVTQQVAFAWYFLATLVLIAVAVWWRTILMITVQIRGRRDEPREPADP